MHNAKSGARKQRGEGKREVLSPIEAAAFDRGQTFKRYVRAAAAMNELYDDVAIGDAVGVSRGAVGKWWGGAKPQPPVVFRLADVTGLSADELIRYLNADGPPPRLPAVGSPEESSVQEGLRRDRQSQQPEVPDKPETSPVRPTRGSGARS